MARNDYSDRARYAAPTLPPYSGPRRPGPAFVRQPGRSALFVHPIIGATYSPGPGLLCECRAICASHVVVKWLRGSEAHVIYRREDFEARFDPATVDSMTQPDLFA